MTLHLHGQLYPNLQKGNDFERLYLDHSITIVMNLFI